MHMGLVRNCFEYIEYTLKRYTFENEHQN